MNTAILQAKRAMELNPSPHNINNYLWLVHLHLAHKPTATSQNTNH
jgi:hypothetical protein